MPQTRWPAFFGRSSQAETSFDVGLGLHQPSVSRLLRNIRAEAAAAERDGNCPIAALHSMAPTTKSAASSLGKAVVGLMIWRQLMPALRRILV